MQKSKNLIFTSLMCFLMVLGMSNYNLLINDDFSILNLTRGVIIGFLVAIILDIFVVGKIAKKITYNLSFINKNKPIQLILTISFLMILGMVTLMSFFGLVLEGGFSSLSFSIYLNAWMMNFIVALPYQLLIVGPFSRYICKI